jgi:transposase
MRTGCQWKALDRTDLCPGSTAHDRFQQWVKGEVFLKLWKKGLEQFAELKGIEWEWLSMDGSMTKAPLGSEDTGSNPTDRGKKGGETQSTDRGARDSHRFGRRRS